MERCFKYALFRLLAVLAVIICIPQDAVAISGDFSDDGGGNYWCNVYVSYTSKSKSYSWLTGDGEDGAMQSFRGFQSEHDGKISTQYPTINIRFRYHHKQSKDFKYNGSSQDIYVMVHGGALRHIASWAKGGSNWNQTDFTYGVIGDFTLDGEWASFRYTPNETGLKNVVAIQIENETYYHQSNFWHCDYDLQIHARYLRGITMDISQAKEPSMEWIAPNKVKLSADNSFLPSSIGNGVSSFNYAANYNVAVVADGKTLSNGSFKASGRGTGSLEVNVPTDRSFNIEVTRNTTTSFQYNGRSVSQNLNENEKTSKRFNNDPLDLNASFNQVTGEMRLQWNNPGDAVRKEGDYQIYRTLLDENGSYRNNREIVGTSTSDFFIDNTSRGLEYGSYYRYEVFQQKKSWGDVEIPSNPEPLTVVTASEVNVSSMPVVPMHLVQDTSVVDNIKFDWEFGNIPNSDSDITFKVHRIDPGGTIRRNYIEVNSTRSAGKASFTDENPESSCEVYGYFVQLDLAGNRVQLFSDTVSAHVLSGTMVANMDASKGTNGNSVVVRWSGRQVGTTPTLFEVQRRYIGSDTWRIIHQVEGTGSTYSYTDNAVEPGRYYEYRVSAYGPDCDGSGRIVNNALTEVGFGQATGVVSGRVQFETGTAVEDVRIDLSRESDETARAPFFSRHILEDGAGLTWRTDTKTANDIFPLNKPFTIQMWINPEANHQWLGLFTIDNYDGYSSDSNSSGYGLYLNKYDQNGTNGYVLAMHLTGTDKWFTDTIDDLPEVIPANQFSHVTIRNNGDGSINCIINGNSTNPHVIKESTNFKFNTDEIPEAKSANVRFFTKIGSKDNTYIGYADEVRVWNRALSDKEIANNYNRILSGRENGLQLYWSFDEGLEEYAFDKSMTDGVRNGNDPILGKNTRPSTITPSGEQLAYYGVTNSKGEYEVRGIPFTGSGTRYSVIPTKGVHDFNPTSRSAFVSTSAMTINNVDFTDVSSFRVRGTIRYSGTTIPVDSVSFYVDGSPCNKNDKLIMSDKNGEYEISVPIGNHYIEARREGHTFVNAGRYPPQEDATYEFLEETNLDFFDNTLVTFAGRITGGNTEGEKPLGYGVSENTIGKAVIKLTAMDHPQRMINAKEEIHGITREWVPNPEPLEIESTTTAIASTSYRGGGDIDEAKYIYITTDETTGEFCAKVPPLRYMVQSIKIPNNSSVENDNVFTNVPMINITNPRDTIRPDTIYTADKQPLPLFKCNQKLMLTYRSHPVIDVTQKGAPEGAFGTDTITVTDQQQQIKLPIYDYNETTKELTYNYKYPIFQQGRSYEFNIKAYEPYTNYDKESTGKLYLDALCDSIITFDNELGTMAKISAMDTVSENGDMALHRGDLVELEGEQVRLDSLGCGTYKWTAGVPALNAPYTRSMNASMVINGQTKLWKTDGLNAVVAGVIPTGTNFITAGPNRVEMVLRDPPGDASSATWGVDTITTKYTYTARGIHQNTELGVEMHAGLSIGVMAGAIAFYKYTLNEIVHENTVTWGYDVNKTWDNRTYTTYTNKQAISTSSAPQYVGRDGDIFIGYSTNYLIGAAEKIGLIKQNDGSWNIGYDEVMCMDENFDTHFEYSQKYIETTLFDNIRRTRNSMIQHINSESEILENPPVPTYYTYLPSTDPKYGSSNNDKETWGSQAKDGVDGPSYWFRYPNGYAGTDSVAWCNQIIEKWIEQLAKNEQDKLAAFSKPSKKKTNESFETGSSISRTNVASDYEQHNSVEVFTTSVFYKGKNGYMLDKAGAQIISNVNIGYHQTKYGVNEKTTTNSFSYTLNDTQRGNAHTVDVYDSTMGWSPIFRTRGGQTRCPYEGETLTKYYNKGTKLDEATMKSDNPHIDMPVRTLSDIPAGQEAQLQIQLTNDSETHDQFSSALLYVLPGTNPDGLLISLNGMPLTNGSEVWLEYGQPLVQTITVKQTNPAVLDYNNVTLALNNSCSNLGGAVDVASGRLHFDEVSFSVHFVPASPPVTLSLNKTILNQKAVLGKEPVVATIKDIDRFFTGLKGIRLKYRFAGDSKWITAHEWVTAAKYLPDGKENDTYSLLSDDEPNINFAVELPDIDGTYYVQAESMTMFGDDEETCATDEIAVVRDTRGPKLLGQAYPNTGFLFPTDDIRIRFNEAIRESYLTKDDNFMITGVLSDATVNHEVSLQLNGTPISTDAQLPINNTDFSTSFWLKRHSGGEILRHGTEDNYVSLAVDEYGYVSLTVNGEKINSTAYIPADKWVFVGLNYFNGDDPNVDVFYAVDATETSVFSNHPVPQYNSDGRVTIGDGLSAAMSNLSVWSKTASHAEILENKNSSFPSYTPGLVGYWKMDEGHGTVVTDYARNRHMYMNAESWNVENTNLAAHLDGHHSMKANISGLDARATDSFVFEMWFRGDAGANRGTALLSITDKMSVNFSENGDLTFHSYNKDDLKSNKTEGNPYLISTTDYNDGSWHHLALNVHRGVSAQFMVDGEMVRTLPEDAVPTPAGDFLHIGSMLREGTDGITDDSRFFTGDIDEVRIWNTASDALTVASNRYSMMDTATVSGLYLYYPMQHSVLDGAGNILTEFSTENRMNPKATGDVTDGITQALTAPALKSAPDERNLNFDYTASNTEIYITLNELASRLHGNCVSFRVKNVRDLADNLSEDIAWSAIVDYHDIEWEETEALVSKLRLDNTVFFNRLTNTGSEATSFTISGAPSWLSVTPATGTLKQGETQSITFEINPGAPVGRLDITLYACNDAGIYVPFVVSLTVHGNVPNWDVDPSAYENTMNIIGQIYVDGKVVQNTNSRIAAFVGNECRGVASPQLVRTRDAYYVTMTVYGHEEVSSPELITFRIYDAGSGVVYGDLAVSSFGRTMMTFYTPNAMLGSYDKPVEWHAGTELMQEVNLTAGWNWISFFVNPITPTLEGIFGHDRSFKTVTSKGDGFGMCDGSKWNTSLERVSPGNMYKVRVTKDINVNVHGSAINTGATAMTMFSGWNWIGSLSVYNLELGEAFADLNPQRGDVVKNKESVAIYNGSQWEGPLNAIFPGEGYYYLNKGDEKTFHYPTITSSNTSHVRASAPDGTSAFKPVDHHMFSDNMNVVARLFYGTTPVDSATVGAFINGECRGAARALDNGLYFITIAGDSGENGSTVKFRTFVNNELVDITEKASFIPDVVLGDLDEPQELHIEGSGISDLSSEAAMVIVSPVVTPDIVNVHCAAGLSVVNVIDGTGRILEHISCHGSTDVATDLSGYPYSIYFIEAITSAGARTVKRVSHSLQ